MSDGQILTRLAELAMEQGPLFVFALVVIVTGYRGVWHWRRELLDMTTDRNYWRSRCEKLDGDLAVRQRQLEEHFMRVVSRGTP